MELLSFHSSCSIIVLSVDNDSQLKRMEYSSVKGESEPSVCGGRKLQGKKNICEKFKMQFSYKWGKSLNDSSTLTSLIKILILYFGHREESLCLMSKSNLALDIKLHKQHVCIYHSQY